ncbi:MAG: carbohydrate kinase family protein [Ruminococcaceae bacterium]|nr:carbohydrate kinase family protein [Oscillospiraceae bacterium]
MTEKKGIAVVGTLLVDNIYEIGAYPDLGELTQIRSVRRALGGLVPNNGIGIKKIAPRLPVYAVGKVGDDDLGRLAVAKMEEAGVDVSTVTVSSTESTSFTDVMSIVGGQRTFFTYPGACASFGAEDVPWDRLPVKMLHLGYFLLLEKVDGGEGRRILEEAKKRGMTTSIDLVSENSDRYTCVIPCLTFVDNLIINELEAGKLCGIAPTPDNLGEMAQKLLSMGVRERVIIHMPEIGICCNRNGSLTVRPSYELPRGYVKGKTGAGDAFCSGALIAIERGATDEEILILAEAAAVASLSEADATSGLCEEKFLPTCKEDLMRN